MCERSFSRTSLRHPLRGWIVALLLCTAMMGIGMNVGAQGTPSNSLSSAQNNRQMAATLLDAGVQRYNAGDFEGALTAFLTSRKLYPTANNTINAAICLVQLRRHVEALELYDAAVRNFPSGVTADVERIIADLSQAVGTLEIAANVHEFIVRVDDGRRIKLRSGGRIRLLAGNRSLRILHDKCQAFDIIVQIEKRTAVKRTIALKPLVAMLSVEAEPNSRSDFVVFVDGTPVGKTPWDGEVGAGKHMVWVMKDNVGSMPTQVDAVRGEIKILRLRSGPLGPPVTLAVEPRTAALHLENLFLGTGRWVGRLPLGTYTFAGMKAGYVPRKVPLRIVQSDKPLVIPIKLEAVHVAAPSEKTAGIVLLTLGSAALATSAVMGLLAIDRSAQVEKNCNDTYDDCKAAGHNAAASGAIFAQASTITFAAGIAGIGVGGLFILTAPQRSTSRSKTAFGVVWTMPWSL